MPFYYVGSKALFTKNQQADRQNWQKYKENNRIDWSVKGFKNQGFLALAGKPMINWLIYEQFGVEYSVFYIP